MEISLFITLIIWAFASSLLLIFTVVGAVIFRDNRQKVFQFYGLYCFLMLLYCLTKIPDFFYSFSQVVAWKSHVIYQSFYWFIQVLFHNAYLSFGIYFLNLSESAPRLTQNIIRYQKMVIPAFTVLTVLVLAGVFEKQLLLQAFSYVFIELHLIVCFLIIYAVRRTKNFSQNYFVVGSLIYMVMILFSFTLSAMNITMGALRPPAIFYAAITVECTIFSAGLGIQIRDVYRQKMKFQKDLNRALKKVQAQMGVKIEKQALAARNQELSAQVLRSQMNSHFVFNVLSSIKLFMRENETEKAVLYLGKFAKFIRRVLDGSIYENNTLQEELETLELYLSIEKMRFNEELDYRISTDGIIDLTNIPFPALLLQPFAENALWHGLWEKEGEKTLQISVMESKNGCRITLQDNGVGRTGGSVPALSQTRRTSHGLKIVHQRIALFNENGHHQLDYSIRDMPDGTEVALNLQF